MVASSDAEAKQPSAALQDQVPPFHFPGRQRCSCGRAGEVFWPNSEVSPACCLAKVQPKHARIVEPHLGRCCLRTHCLLSSFTPCFILAGGAHFYLAVRATHVPPLDLLLAPAEALALGKVPAAHEYAARSPASTAAEIFDVPPHLPLPAGTCRGVGLRVISWCTCKRKAWHKCRLPAGTCST